MEAFWVKYRLADNEEYFDMHFHRLSYDPPNISDLIRRINSLRKRNNRYIVKVYDFDKNAYQVKDDKDFLTKNQVYILQKNDSFFSILINKIKKNN